MAGALIGNYRLLDEISTGGMGTVYRAKHELIGRPAAVKLLRPDLDMHQVLIDRFFNEAKAATAIRHPGIVEVFDFGYTDDGHGYLVMELLVGKSLTRALADVERFSELEAATIARGIASALKAAHASGIYHRDLKPDNVFLVPDLEGQTGALRPKVLDFGIAKLSENAQGHTQMGMLIGTPLYMAPEQAREASAIDHRADLYSLGCILYELLVGRPPFVSEGAGEIVAMHLMEQPTPPCELAPHLSATMNAIVMRLLEKDPDRRFQSAGELATALLPLIDPTRALELSLPPSGPRVVVRHEPTTTHAIPAASPTITMPPRSRSLPIILGVVAATIAIAVIVAIALRDSSTPTTPATPKEPAPEKVHLKAEPTTETAPVRVEPPTPTETKLAPDKKPIVVSPPKSVPPVIKPRGPTTTQGAPIEDDLSDKKKKEPRT